MRWLSTLILALVVSSGASRASAASVDGLNVYSVSSGKGKAAVVLVHGWTCDSTSPPNLLGYVDVAPRLCTA